MLKGSNGTSAKTVYCDMPVKKKKKSFSPHPKVGPGKSAVRLHLWLQTDDGVAFCLGRLMLLEAIEENGSLKSAAERLGMSYRAAWGKIKSSENALGAALVEKSGGNRSGYTLTPYGQQLKSLFQQWRQDVELKAQERAQELFPLEIKVLAQKVGRE